MLTPFFADQPANARRVAAAGAGIVLGPNADSDGPALPLGPADVAPLRAAIDAVLSQRSFGVAARQIAAEMAAAPLIDDQLELLAPR